MAGFAAGNTSAAGGLEARVPRALPYPALLVEGGRASPTVGWLISDKPTIRQSEYCVVSELPTIRQEPIPGMAQQSLTRRAPCDRSRKADGHTCVNGQESSRESRLEQFLNKP